MRFTILGSGTLVPDPARAPAGFLLQSEGRDMLVDGGSGTLGRLVALGLDPRKLDGGIYSHRHIDHTGDLVSLLFSMRVGIDLLRSRHYPIWAGRGFQAHLNRLISVYGHWIVSPDYRVQVTELPLDGPGHAQLPGGVRLDTLPALHSEGALHLKFTGPAGDTVVFSGDTGPSDGLISLAIDANLLVCECALGEHEDYPYHLKASDVAAIVAAARPHQVALTHIYPTNDPVAAVARVASTGIPTCHAYDGQSFDLALAGAPSASP